MALGPGLQPMAPWKPRIKVLKDRAIAVNLDILWNNKVVRYACDGDIEMQGTVCGQWQCIRHQQSQGTGILWQSELEIINSPPPDTSRLQAQIFLKEYFLCSWTRDDWGPAPAPNVLFCLWKWHNKLLHWGGAQQPFQGWKTKETDYEESSHWKWAWLFNFA